MVQRTTRPGLKLWAQDDGLIPLRRAPGWALGLLMLGLITLTLAGLCGGGTLRLAPPRGSDATLYSRTVQDMAGGEPYYVAAPRELRRGGFPLRPFMAVRPPLLATLLARLPDEAARHAALLGLAGLTLGAWAWRLRPEPGGASSGTARWALGVSALAAGLAPVLSDTATMFHETWAGVLIALSLSLYRPLALHRPHRRGAGAWGASLAVGLLAALLRELAAPYLLVMALFALLEGRRGEAAAWGAALAAFAVALAVHAHAVGQVTTPADLHSPGWLGLGGWPFVLSTARWTALTALGPPWMAALLLPAAGLGLLAMPGPLGRRAGAVALGYMAGFLVVGRADNAYWGLLIAPLWPLGLAQADRVLAEWLRRRRPLTAPLEPAHAG